MERIEESCECHQGRNRRRHRRNEKVAAAAWLMGAGVFCLILWAVVVKAIIE